MLPFYGWLRYLIATDRGEVIWGILIVLAVAIFTGSETATAIAALLVVAALIALWRLNRVPRPKAPPSDAKVRPILVAAAFCAVVAAVFSKLGLFAFGFGITMFALIAYVAFSVSRPRRP